MAAVAFFLATASKHGLLPKYGWVALLESGRPEHAESVAKSLIHFAGSSNLGGMAVEYCMALSTGDETALGRAEEIMGSFLRGYWKNLPRDHAENVVRAGTNAWGKPWRALP